MSRAFVDFLFLFFFTNNDRFSKLATAFTPVERSGLDLCAFKSRDESDGRDEGCPRGTFPTREVRNVEKSNVENIQTDLLSKQIVRPQCLNNETFVTINLLLIFASRYLWYYFEEIIINVHCSVRVNIIIICIYLL